MLNNNRDVAEERPDNENLQRLQNKMRSKSRMFWLCIATAAFSAVLFSSLFFFSLSPVDNKAIAMPREDVVYIKIKPGMTADNVGDILQENGIIKYKCYFWLLAKFNGADSKLKVGTYKVTRNMDTGAVLQLLLSGDTAVQVVTIPEGFTINEIAARLENENIISADEFKKFAKSYIAYDYMGKEDTNIIYRSEGFLFPDTYEIESEATAEDLLSMMMRNFDEQLTPELRKRAAERNISLFELVTMASLVEKEAMFEEDRAVIAQVLLKRWEISMPLQSDASLQYLMDAPKEDVSIEDTKIDSPYNTYQNYGLPPGPVANPGAASIKAVLYPADTDYLYFVADRQGHNHYSKTYEEHLAIVAQVR